MTIKGASIMDIAPTIQYLMGHPVSQDMDGRVLLEIVENDFKVKTPVCES